MSMWPSCRQFLAKSIQNKTKICYLVMQYFIRSKNFLSIRYIILSFFFYFLAGIQNIFRLYICTLIILECMPKNSSFFFIHNLMPIKNSSYCCDCLLHLYCSIFLYKAYSHFYFFIIIASSIGAIEIAKDWNCTLSILTHIWQGQSTKHVKTGDKNFDLFLHSS